MASSSCTKRRVTSTARPIIRNGSAETAAIICGIGVICGLPITRRYAPRRHADTSPAWLRALRASLFAFRLTYVAVSAFPGHTAGLTAGRALSSWKSMNTTQETASPPTNYLNAAPGAFKAMVGLESYLKGCGIEANLIELVKLRVSQMNGCAYCIDNHSKKLLSGGELNQRLYLLGAWRDANCYSEREQAAFAWAEAVTRISESQIDGPLHAKVRKHFTEKELVDLTLTVIAINGWNRLNISFRIPAGFQF